MRSLGAKYITKKFGSSYFYASLFLPKSIQHKVFELYKFVRIPDEIVDRKDGDYAQAQKELLILRNEFIQALENKDIENEKWGASVQLFLDCHIDQQYVIDFYAAMLQDCIIHRYDTYEQLQDYMYGSAEVVGIMMCCVLNAQDSSISYARKLGEAMQYTNFLRDVYEDYTDYGRIYIPRDRLAVYGLEHADIIDMCLKHDCSETWKDFMKREVDRCRYLYQQAEPGIHLLPRGSHMGIRLSSRLYEAILDKIESIEYNVFAHSARTSKRRKSRIISKTLLTEYIKCPCLLG